MKVLASNSKWLGLGLGVWAVLACSAEASEPPTTPGNTAGTTAAGGTGGSGTAGTSTLPLAGTTSTGTAGSSTGTGGTGSGTAGTTSTAGTGTGGTGAGGGGALTTCPSPPAAGAIADLLIDDLEDGDNGVSKVGNRTGYWYTYLDAFGSTITPTPDATGAKPLVPGTTMCHGGSTKCVIITGMTAAEDTVSTPPKYPYAGVGFDFSNAKKPCVYNASAYTGIKFWARGDVVLTIKVNTVQSADAGGGGSCVGEMCNGGFSATGAGEILNPDWTEYTVPFATAMGPTWGVAGPPDKSQLLSVQFQIPSGQASYTVAVDDISFY